MEQLLFKLINTKKRIWQVKPGFETNVNIFYTAILAAVHSTCQVIFGSEAL